MAAILETDMKSDTLISLGLFFRAQAIELLEKIKELGKKNRHGAGSTDHCHAK